MHINKKTIITKEIDESLLIFIIGLVFRSSHQMNNAMENMANVDNLRNTEEHTNSTQLINAWTDKHQKLNSMVLLVRWLC